MPKVLVFLVSTLILFGCKKENTIKITVHESSKKWLQSAFPKTYISNFGDTLTVESATQKIDWLSNYVDVAPNSGFTDLQRIYQTVAIDSVTTLSTELYAALIGDNERNDSVCIALSWLDDKAVFWGKGAPDMVLSVPPAFYFEDFTINGKSFSDVYLAEYAASGKRITAYITLAQGLVGFERSGEIYVVQ